MKPHIIHVFSSFAIGGYEVRACDIINYLGDKVRHTIYAIDNNFDCKCKISKDLLPNISMIPLQFHKKSTIKNIGYFRKILKEGYPNLLLTYNWGSIEFALANSLKQICPNIHAEDGFNIDEAYKQKKRRILTRMFILRQSFKVVVPSLVLKNIALKKWRLPFKKLDYIPNGINFNDYAIDIDKKESNANIGIVAGLSGVKNHLRLFRSILKLDKKLKFTLKVVGDGPKRDELELFVKKHSLEDKITFLGYAEDPKEIIKGLNIFCLSSNSEQMPISVLEAMAAGCAVVSTDVGDVKEMVSEENKKFIIQKDDEQAYADALESLITNEKMRKELGYRNQVKCKTNYSRELMLQTYQELYFKAIEKYLR